MMAEAGESISCIPVLLSALIADNDYIRLNFSRQDAFQRIVLRLVNARRLNFIISH
jgi:hypothetical protein